MNKTPIGTKAEKKLQRVVLVIELDMVSQAEAYDVEDRLYKIIYNTTKLISGNTSVNSWVTDEEVKQNTP